MTLIYEMDEEALSIKRIFLSAFLSGLVGVGGGFAAALGIILMGELPKSDNNESILFVFSLCLVAGFAARRLLPEMSDQLMDRLSRAEGTSREALKEAEETSILSRARATVGAKRTGVELDKCINDLVGLRATEPNDRESAILLGRCFRLKGDLEGAISALDSFLKRKEKAKEYDDDFADVLFNKACYLSLLAEPEQGDQKTSEAHAKQAFSVLQRSIEYSPTNLDDAIHDDDLRMVRELPEFQELLTKKRP